MQRLSLSVCSLCRISVSQPVHPQNWFTTTQYLSRRFRSSKAKPTKFRKRPSNGFGEDFAGRGYVCRNRSPRPVRETQIPVEELPAYLALKVASWAGNARIRSRLMTFGIPQDDIPILLREFGSNIRRGLLKKPGMREKYTLDRFSGSHTGTHNGRTNQALTNIFYRWASDPDNQPYLETKVPPTTLHGIIQLHSAADLSYPADSYPEARSIRRKFYMHVGPTNSGKTHAALRALAAAGSGVYAGPLRLLAHEVWERLNKGLIIPLGMPEADTEPDTVDTAAKEGSSAPAVVKGGNPKYARECNLLTGEETKVVSEEATLLSCTIEMVKTSRMFDVGVVDEIQLIANPDRGGGWTRAVLGLYAKEIHLCGEETAIPVIQALLRETGDELVIHRYERLTPLVVQDESLEGDLRRVQKGDCLVTFTRTNIYMLKQQVEELTGMRCAVAYGKLPPEIRSEQAALFNDPESGYDVIIGSDAIGMGLNLRIKRIIFEAIHKWNGTSETQLSDPQIKQIAGRAGRYGLHDDSPGGFVTTVNPNDLPILREALASPVKPLSVAYFSEMRNAHNIVNHLPLSASSRALHETYHYVSHMKWPFDFPMPPRMDEVCDFIDTTIGDLTLEDKILLSMAPVPWRDESDLITVLLFFRQYRNHMRVDLIDCLQAGGTLAALDQAQSTRGPPGASTVLRLLESLHRLLILYMWMHQRSPVAWCDYVEVHDLKERTERTMDECLQRISWGRGSRQLADITMLRQRREGERIAYMGRRDIETLQNARRQGRRATETS